MALTVSVSGDAILGRTIQVSDIAFPDKYVSLVRHDPSGAYDDVYVRGAYLVPTDTVPGPETTEMIFYDYEAPLGLAVEYVATEYSDSAGTTVTDTGTSSSQLTSIPNGFAILIDPLVGPNRASGTVVSFDAWSRSGQVLGNHRVIGRSAPVIITDVTSSRSGSITMANFQVFDIDYDGNGPYTQYESVAGGWEEMFATGNILLFRSDYTKTGFKDCYLHVESIETSRLSRVVGSHTYPILAYTIGFTEVDRPSFVVESTPIFTWQDVLDNYSTWSEVNSSFTDWQDVLNNPIP